MQRIILNSTVDCCAHGKLKVTLLAPYCLISPKQYILQEDWQRDWYIGASGEVSNESQITLGLSHIHCLST